MPPWEDVVIRVRSEMGKNKGKNRSVREDNPGKGQSLQNIVKYELSRYTWESSARGKQLAAQNLYLDQFNLASKGSTTYPQLRVFDPLQQQKHQQGTSGAASALQRTWSSMKELDRQKEAATKARWHYSSPRVRMAREKLLQDILRQEQGEENREASSNGSIASSACDSACDRSRDNGSELVRRLCELCLENIAANLQRYDATELAEFVKVSTNFECGSCGLGLEECPVNALSFHTCDVCVKVGGV